MDKQLEAIITVADIAGRIQQSGYMAEQSFNNQRRLAIAINHLGYERDAAVKIAQACGFGTSRSVEIAEWAENPAQIHEDVKETRSARTYEGRLDTHGYLPEEAMRYDRWAAIEEALTRGLKLVQQEGENKA